MGIFDFLKFNGNSKPSKMHIRFSKSALEIIGTLVEQNGFTFHRKTIDKYSTNILWRNDKRYVRVFATDFPTDYPYYFSIKLGEGDSEDFFEYDWNSISILEIGKIKEPNKKFAELDFPKISEMQESLEFAKSQLSEFGTEFLNGNLDLFYKVRKLANGERKPYRIIKKDADGNEIINFMPESVKQKKEI